MSSSKQTSILSKFRIIDNKAKETMPPDHNSDIISAKHDDSHLIDVAFFHFTAHNC